MKLILLFIMCASANFLFSQSVTVDTKKYTAIYKDEYRQDTAVFYIPLITGGADKNIIAQLNSYLSPDAILGENIDSVISNYKDCGCGTVGSDFTVLYNQNGALSISVRIETMGAYPDMFYSDINLNLNTGKAISIGEIIKESSFNELATKLDKIVQQRIKDKVNEDYSADNIDKEYLEQIFTGDKFTVENLSSYAIKPGGIMFYYNFDLPHVIKALSPDEDIWMSNEDLSSYYTMYGKKLH